MTASMLRLQHLVPENAIRFLGHPEHTHDAPHLVYVASGSARLTVEGRTMTLRARESAWLDAHVPHSATYARNSLVLGPLLSPATAPPTPVLWLGVVADVVDIMTTVLGVAPQSSEQVAPFRRALDDVLTALRSPHFVLIPPTHPVVAKVVRDCLRAGSSLDDAAAVHGVSARHVQRVVLAETGMSFQTWRARARLNTAIAHLRGGASLAGAARSAGFATGSGLRKALVREVAPEALAPLLLRSPLREMPRASDAPGVSRS